MRSVARVKFLVGEPAPTAEAFYGGETVVDSLGHLAMRLVDRQSIVLDVAVQPPVLLLKDALVIVTQGSVFDGQFEAHDTNLEHRMLATGDYTGPGSELTCISPDN